MSAGAAVDDLRAALLERARRQADQIRSEGQQRRARLMQEADERLRLREEREVLYAQALAERRFQQRLQARRLQLQGELDHLRWELAQTILERAREHLRQFAAGDDRYPAILRALLQSAAAAAGGGALIAEVNAHDLQALRRDWDAVRTAAPAASSLRLSAAPCACSGGARVRDEADRVRVDNSFEARIARWRDELMQSVVERLFGGLTLDELMRG